MLPAFRRRRHRTAAPTITPRSDTATVARVELADLAPAPVDYLGRLGCISLALFENLSRGVMAAPAPETKSRLVHVAGELGAAHEAIIAELRQLRADPAVAMGPHQAELDDFQRRIRGEDWHEILITCYLTAGFLSDFSAGLAAGLPPALGDRMGRLFDVSDGEATLVELLRAEIDGHPRLASRLALWGRRLVGDTLLVARGSLRIDGVGPVEERIEPVFSELVAAHTRRMDALGLTA